MSEKEIQNHDEGIKLYELGFNLVSSLTEEDLDKEFINLKEIISKNSKEIVSESKPALIDLAYTMIKTLNSKKQRYDTAYFGWIKFMAEAEDILKLKGELDNNDSILRFIILKAVKDEGEISSEDIAKIIKGEDLEEKKEENKDKDNKKSSDKSEEDVKEKEETKDDSKDDSKEKRVNEEEVDEAIEKLVK